MMECCPALIGERQKVGVERRESHGVIAESVPNRTLSGIEERGAQISQGRNPCLSGSDGQT